MKIAVAMSGGVDSSVAAYILKEQGHNIIGVTMRHFDNEKMHFSKDEGINRAIIDAKNVCEKLGIPHFEIDVREEFEKTIIKDFINEYKNGRTPNPCTLCNKTIKWGAFADKIFNKFDVEKIATGHYVRIKYFDNKYHLFKSEDIAKDQTYMLWELTQNQLSKTIFPLSELKKSLIREIAQNIGLDVAKKKDSQEVCFIKGHYGNFFKEYLNPKSGNIKFKDGRIIGKHKGTVFYTIGQRKGLNTPWTSPLYVYKIDVIKNEIYVTDNKEDLFKKKFSISQSNWINFPYNFDDIFVMVRYNSKPTKVKEIIPKNQNRFDVVLTENKKSITPGQSAVFYKDNELLGGGIIEID